jgi:hypothetical protein
MAVLRISGRASFPNLHHNAVLDEDLKPERAGVLVFLEPDPTNPITSFEITEPVALPPKAKPLNNIAVYARRQRHA